MLKLVVLKRNLKKILLLLFFCIGCDLVKSDYDLLMQKTKEEKVREEKNGIPSRIFDSFQEPHFPTGDIDSLEGVDLNKDGIRDDIEIWINRNAESDQIRVAFKDYYKKTLKVFEDINKGVSDEEYSEAIRLQSLSGVCLVKAGRPYDKVYDEKYELGAGSVYSVRLHKLFSNTPYRKKIYRGFEKRDILGAIHNETNLIREYCKKLIN